MYEVELKWYIMCYFEKNVISDLRLYFVYIYFNILFFILLRNLVSFIIIINICMEGFIFKIEIIFY